MKKHVTIRDIARMLDISHSTVSRALNDSPRVNPSTKQRIVKLAKELNFEFDSGGRSLSSRRTGIVAVICPSEIDDFSRNQFFHMLLQSLRRNLESIHLDALILEAYNPKTGSSNIARLIRQNRVDGFLLVHARIKQDDVRMIRESQKPMIQVHAQPKYYDLDSIDSYMTDNVMGGRAATELLIKNGCSRIINLVSCRNYRDSHEFGDRVIGYSRALNDAGIPIDPDMIIDSDCTFQSGYRAVHTYPHIFRRADGVFAQADIVALGCLFALRELGISVPGSIQLVGYDDSPLCLLPDTHMTSVHQPYEAISEIACQRIKGLLDIGDIGDYRELGTEEDQPAIEHVLLSPKIIYRDTTITNDIQ